jgi:pimeloyl-ACP methyl ester carboxylesterase
MDSSIITFSGAENTEYSIRVYQGGQGADLLFIHGAGGLLADDPFLARLSEHFRVTAPVLPGYEDSEGSDHLRDMLDFTLHAYDVWRQLGLDNPMLVGHSMGGMIAAEMAAIAPDKISKLVLLCPAGLWLDDHEIADIFASLPYELPGLLFHDPEQHGGLLSAGGDLNDPEFLTDFMVGNARRLGTAGKLLFPVPDRGLRDRLYRVQAKTELIWGTSDKLIPRVYGDEFARLLPNGTLHNIDAAGHMVQYEQPDACMDIILSLHNEQ